MATKFSIISPIQLSLYNWIVPTVQNVVPRSSFLGWSKKRINLRGGGTYTYWEYRFSTYSAWRWTDIQKAMLRQLKAQGLYNAQVF